MALLAVTDLRGSIKPLPPIRARSTLGTHASSAEAQMGRFL